MHCITKSLVDTCPRLPLSQKYLPVIFARLALISQYVHEGWGRKSLAIACHKNPFMLSQKEV